MTDRIRHSEPISIPASGNHHRARSASYSSDDDDSNSPPLQTPTSTAPPPRVATSPSTSPILSYFFANSPTKPPLTFALPPTKSPVFTQGLSPVTAIYALIFLSYRAERHL